MRAILHAAFSVGLAKYCGDRNLQHPGFVVLDSPLVTYRPPDQDDPGPDNDEYSALAGRFYSDMHLSVGCQVIVMENIDPPAALPRGAIDVQFTKRDDVGRYGFFPRLANA